MIKRIMSLLSLLEQTMIQEQKMLELSVRSFELSIENHENGKKIDILRLELRKKHILFRDKTREDLEELEYTNEALRILKMEDINKLRVERKITKSHATKTL